MINVYTTSRYKINRAKCKRVAENVLKSHDIDSALELNLVFVGKRKMRSIAQKYKNEDVALPVLSFRYTDEPENNNLLGEVFLCYPQVVLLAAERNKTVDVIMSNMIEHGITNLFKQ